MTKLQRPRPVVLCVLDGWGDRSGNGDNAILNGETPNWDRFMANCPHGRLDASAEAVGLPAGQMGNSEVGHMNLGAGRVVPQDLPRINEAVAAGALTTNPRLRTFIARLKESGGVCHLMGLVSPGGVHSHQDHIAALARAVAEAGIPVALHIFLDGRDTPPKSAEGYLRALLDEIDGLPETRVATVGGRYHAMDRDNRWERTARAYAAMVTAEGESAPDPSAAVAAAYAAGITDEFVAPTVIADYAGMADGDGVLMANFRADRARQILAALLDPEFDGFARSRRVDFAAALGMVRYSKALDRFLATLFPPLKLDNILGAVVARAGLNQLRIAETEKYAH
ncbi:MAG: 2,3-bisphosphoglycerate-independent phosphoglycerate mutase, partial [Alphaproteobacteria bacterium]